MMSQHHLPDDARLQPASEMTTRSIKQMMKQVGVKNRRSLMRHLEQMSRSDMIRFSIDGDRITYVLILPPTR